MRRQIAALAVLFLAAHLLLLPPTLEDLDSINFALGVRDFDVVKHQPHPPGYPVFVALAKTVSTVLRLAGVPEPELRGLSVLSAFSGAACVPLLFAFYMALAGDARLAWWSMAVAVCAPLFWFTALRPLSDIAGLAFALGAQALLLGVLSRRSANSRRRVPLTGAGLKQGEVLAPTGRGGSTVSSDVRTMVLDATRIAVGDQRAMVVIDDRGPMVVDHQRATNNEPRTAKLLIAGALLAGIATGVRLQMAVLTLPLLLVAVISRATGITVRHRAAALLAAAAGVAAWGVPMIVATGGLGNYLAALGSQAGEDFSGVVMLWTTRTPRAAADALLFSLVWPWGLVATGTIVLALSAAGAARAFWKMPRALSLLAIAFGPYAAFHLLFHETATIRYALPLIVPMSFLVMIAVSAAGARTSSLAATALVAAMLVVTVPTARAFARDGSPAFRAFRAAVAGGGWDGRPLAMHAGMRRVEEWERERHSARVLRAPHGHEWLTMVEAWRKDPEATVRFLADPRRTDLLLFDPQARERDVAARWTFRERPFVGGTRPGATDVYTMRPPGWMLDRGWALSAEIGGVTARDGLGPHVEPSIAWVRARDEEALLMIGGRNLAATDRPSTTLTLATAAGPIESFTVPRGFFFRRVLLRAGVLAGAGYVPVSVRAATADRSGRPAPVSLEQFDLQLPGTPMFGFVEGWGEPEYGAAIGRGWRWMSERATLWVRPVGTDLELTIIGESPLRYFDRPPQVRAIVAGREVARFSPSSDFERVLSLPSTLLEASAGEVVLESDLWFSPAQQGRADQRHLSLRIYSVTVKDNRRKTATFPSAPAPAGSFRSAYRSGAARRLPLPVRLTGRR